VTGPVLLDTNVIVAALVAGGLCREVVHRAVRLRIIASPPPLLDELEATLQRKFRLTPAASAFLKALRQQIRLVEPPSGGSRMSRSG
jgi:predicted nucleic acid-binding protein